MLEVRAFFEAIRGEGIDFITGVPDSLLKDFCAYVTDHSSGREHVIAANEGGAVALAAGHYLATGKPALVYMQNSGQGNAVNPLTSLADSDVFGIPMLLLVGWRGEPGVADEPQHVKQGKITLELFRTLGIPCEILPAVSDDAVKCLRNAVERMRTSSSPVALVVRASTFGRYKLQSEAAPAYELTRECALKLVLDRIGDRDVVVATTGMTSREMCEARESARQPHAGDFRTVGCMGHASQIALGLAMARPDHQVFCLDGDGAVIMHMGSLATIASQKPDNFRHVVFNNGAHDSVGGQPTGAFDIDLPAIALACGYRFAARAETAVEIGSALTALRTADAPALLEIRVRKGARANLGRPKASPADNKRELMRHLGV